MSSWKIIYQNFNPEEEKLREALCTLGNGYFATRGAQPEAFDSESHYPGTYVAGGYNKIGTPLAGRTIYNEDLVNCPNWLIIRFKIDNGEWVTLSSSTILSYRQELDMHRGILTRNTRLKSKDGKITTVETCRIVSMANPHVAAMKYVITPENYEGRITIQSMLDGTVINNGVARYRQLRSKHLIPWSVQTFDRDGISLSVKTSQSNIYISQACRIKIFVNNKKMRTRCEIIKKNKGKIYQECTFFVKKKKSYAVEKIVSLFTSKDSGIKNYRHAAISVFKKQHTFTALLKEHVRAWKTLWEMFDIKITGDAFAQKVLRLHMFHLIQTASKHSITVDAGMPARGLHGEAYRGHIFWDELFIMPLYDFHVPEISKSLLMYRYRRLGQARKYAKKYGYNGAMFPWQSGSSGVEETQIVHLNPLSGKWGPDYSSIQRHISFAIAYNVWQYWQRTGDKSFFIRYGAEMILSIAQFVSSLAKYDQKKGRYYTEGIMGPDEFHEQLPGSKKHGLKNNSYSNVFMVWTLRKALETINAIISPHEKGRLLRKLNITQKELSRWDAITKKMEIIINSKGVISQFDGYFKLKELDWKHYKKKYKKIARMDRILKAEGKTPDAYKVAKQADLLMLFYLFPLNEIRALLKELGYPCHKNLMKNNYEYYIKRTSHGSTLSKVVHGYIAHLLRKSHESWNWFIEILKSDIADTQGGTTPKGIHTGVMGGSIDMVMRAFAGIDIINDRITIAPQLPKQLQSITLTFCFKQAWFTATVSKKRLSIRMTPQKGNTRARDVHINNKVYCLRPKKQYAINLN